ncbi:sugar transferase [Falsiruegeria mediterranea]|uniref:Undecaprenyl phosphate N,N'-diacetylbacillosamine 1-phosphate transferase n=1 Tax=Falsiruegeria mediterranea M17 TaxID=1200281 RepID=A0A2R8C6U6_9RHOB|nr:sugar transferase [Falsiruegeria mediterranea]SPJ28135.1 Undecaprenyl phosphate N,N'-diacetylbacillosamine 1-phosphate transferase [Falsiruegeria mediterranea M17]
MKDYVQEAALEASGRVIAIPNDGVGSVAAMGVVPANINAGVEASAKGLGQSTYALFGKRVLDVSLIVLTAPIWMLVIGICAIALMLEGGNPFYRQTRLGRGGRSFKMLKLRTMVMDADVQFDHLMKTDPALRHEWETTQKLKNDPRITRVGNILRKTSLDELPQLWNVLIGDMSLVGPRPMMPDQLPLYGPSGPYLSLRPGITGLWQVSARNEEVFSFRSRVDATYARSVSFRQDVVLLFKTLGVVARRTGY